MLEIENEGICVGFSKLFNQKREKVSEMKTKKKTKHNSLEEERFLDHWR